MLNLQTICTSLHIKGSDQTPSDYSICLSPHQLIAPTNYVGSTITDNMTARWRTNDIILVALPHPLEHKSSTKQTTIAIVFGSIHTKPKLARELDAHGDRIPVRYTRMHTCNGGPMQLWCFECTVPLTS